MRRMVEGELPWPLFICGPTGTGKTLAALCLADRVERTPIYIKADTFAKELARAMTGKNHNPVWGMDGANWEAQVWERTEKCGLFILDEMVGRPASDHLLSAVLDLLDIRVRKPLILISNGDLPAVAQVYDDRVASRISAGTIFQFSNKAAK